MASAQIKTPDRTISKAHKTQNFYAPRCISYKWILINVVDAIDPDLS